MYQSRIVMFTGEKFEFNLLQKLMYAAIYSVAVPLSRDFNTISYNNEGKIGGGGGGGAGGGDGGGYDDDQKQELYNYLIVILIIILTMMRIAVVLLVLVVVLMVIAVITLMMIIKLWCIFQTGVWHHCQVIRPIPELQAVLCL